MVIILTIIDNNNSNNDLDDLLQHAYTCINADFCIHVAWDPIQDPCWSHSHISAPWQLFIYWESTAYHKNIIRKDTAITIGHWKQLQALRAAVLGVQLAVYKDRRD